MRTKCNGFPFDGIPGPGGMGLKQKVTGFLVLEVRGYRSELILRMYNEGANPGEKRTTEKGPLKSVPKLLLSWLIPKLHTQGRYQGVQQKATTGRTKKLKNI